MFIVLIKYYIGNQTLKFYMWKYVLIFKNMYKIIVNNIFWGGSRFYKNVLQWVWTNTYLYCMSGIDYYIMLCKSQQKLCNLY